MQRLKSYQQIIHISAFLSDLTVARLTINFNYLLYLIIFYAFMSMDREQVWKQVLAEVEIQLSKPNFVTWFKNSQLVDTNEDGRVVVGLSNNFAKEWVENKYHKLISEIFYSLDSSVKRVEYTVLNLSVEQKPQTHQRTQLVSNQPELIEIKIDPETNLHPRYNFKSFIVGSSNELAYAAAMAVVREVSTKYNPLFIYGGTGLGKTHLLQAIGNEIRTNYKARLKTKYVTSEKFVNDIISGIRNKRMEDIKEKYRSVDVLIIDDIQFIAGKERSEEEFFHTFNVLYDSGKQIIISSDRPPAATPILEERLRSRFSGGMIADVGYPDYEMRVAIIKSKIREKGVDLPDELCSLIASKIQRNIRELEGVLNKIAFYKEVKDIDPSMDLINEIIEKNLRQTFKNISPLQIIRAVSGFFEITEKEISDHSRRKELVEPRQIAMYLLKDVLGMSYSDIGNKLGKRDHSTVIHACEKISKKINIDPKLNQKVILLREIVEKV